MHTGQFRVVDTHRTRFLASRNCWFALHFTVALSLLRGCGGESSASSRATPLTITATSLPAGTIRVSYSATLTAAGGTGAGTPIAAGTFSSPVQVTDSPGVAATEDLSAVIAAAGALTNHECTGDISPVHDPSIIRQRSTYYKFSTDASSTQGGFMPIRCSTAKIAWSSCGFVFATLPSWISGAVPQQLRYGHRTCPTSTFLITCITRFPPLGRISRRWDYPNILIESRLGRRPSRNEKEVMGGLWAE
jgi:hypothetical protein